MVRLLIILLTLIFFEILSVMMFYSLFFFAIGYASLALSMLVRSSSSNDQLMSAVAFVYGDIYGTIIYATLGRWL